ncbi:response regulator [Rhodobacteraceae bacterium NNCM2]|nr:response regulator [Coraliihabitans acroporae]
MTKKVLLAEDEPHIIESLSFLLDRAGFEIATEMNGARALDRALNNPPDVMLLDVMLPEIDGFEMLRQLRADPRTTTLPVVMLTAKGQREDRDRATRLGADVFITKPFSNAEVVETVTRLAEHGRA